MTTGQITRKHVLIRNKGKSSDVCGLVFSTQMSNQGLSSNRFKARGTSNCLGASGIGPEGGRPSICWIVLEVFNFLCTWAGVA